MPVAFVIDKESGLLFAPSMVFAAPILGFALIFYKYRTYPGIKHSNAPSGVALPAQTMRAVAVPTYAWLFDGDYIALFDPSRLYKAAEQHKFTLRQTLAARRKGVRDPGQSLKRMPHDVRSLSGTYGCAVDRHQTFHSRQIQASPVKHRRTQYAAGTKEVISDQCWSVDRFVVSPPIID